MECEEIHYVTIKMTYEEARKLAGEINRMSDEIIKQTPILTLLWNKLP